MTFYLLFVFFFLCVKLIHDQIIDSLQFFFVFDGTQNGLTVFFNVLENADFQVHIFVSVHSGNNCQIGETVVFQGADEDVDLEVSILKSVEEDGEPILCAIEDEEELKAVYDLIMDELYAEEEDED